MPRTATDVPNPLKINHKSHSAFGSMIIRVSDTTIMMPPHIAPSACNAKRILFIVWFNVDLPAGINDLIHLFSYLLAGHSITSVRRFSYLV